jgi:hypothetical protein
VLDGVFSRPSPEAAPVFDPLPAPTDGEIAQILAQIHERVTRLLRRWGRLPKDPSPSDPVAERRDGSTHLLLDLLELIEKLRVLIPRPGFTRSGPIASWPPAPSFAPRWSPGRPGPSRAAADTRHALRRRSPRALPRHGPAASPGRP